MRTDRNSTNLPDFSTNLPAETPATTTPATTTPASTPKSGQASTDKGAPKDGVQSEGGQPQWLDSRPGKQDTGLADFSSNLPGASQAELQALALGDSAHRYLETSGLKEALSFLVRTPQEGATIKDLKNLLQNLGHGGVLERSFDHSIGHKVSDAFQALAKSPFAGGNINDFKQILAQLAKNPDPGQAISQFKDLGGKLTKLAEDAKKNGLTDLSERLSQLSDGAGQLAKFAQTARNLHPDNLQNFATKLGKDVKDLRSLEDLKTLADKNGVGGLLGEVLDSDVGKNVQTLIKAAESFPEAKKKAEQFLGTLKELKGKSPEELAKHLKDLPGGLQEFSKLARQLGQGDLAGKLDSAVNRFKQVSDLAKDLKGLSPQKAYDEAAKRLKNIAPKDVLDEVTKRLPLPTYRKEGSFSAEAAAYKRKDTIGSKDGNYYMEHELELLSAGAKGRGSVTADFKNGKFQAEGEIEAHASLIRARAQGHVRYGIVEAEGNAALDVGARAAARGSATFDLKERKILVEGQAGAFAGAEAVAEGKVDVGGVGLQGRAGVRAGVGVNIGGSFGYDKGKVTFGFNLGASLGIGFDLGFKISIDFAKIGDTIKKYVPGAGAVMEAATKTVSVIKDGVQAAGNAIKSAGKSIKKFFGF